jgi:hypothetical protein
MKCHYKYNPTSPNRTVTASPLSAVWVRSARSVASLIPTPSSLTLPALAMLYMGAGNVITAGTLYAICPKILFQRIGIIKKNGNLYNKNVYKDI